MWAQQWGIGLRAGDPTGLTAKRFMGDKAREINIGQTVIWGFDARREFDNDYRYRYWVGNDRRECWDSVNNKDIGADLIGGLDFTFDDIPLSIFGDMNLFVELLDSSFFLRLQGSAGVRYNF